MREVTAQTKDAWLSGHYVGDNRAYARVTIERMHVNLYEYVVEKATSKTWAHSGKFASAIFGSENRPRELNNVQAIKWQRGVDQDVGTCTITLANSRLLKPGELQPPNDDDFDLPGWFTPNYGVDSFFTRWNYQPNGWKNWIAPDRIIRTYEGYGIDRTVIPELDPHMYASGVWLIDDVTFTPDGLIELQCRDLGRLLLDHICFPPVVPWGAYPLIWEAHDDKADRPIPTPTAGDWFIPKYDTDSNQFYIGTSAVSGDGSINGHHGRDAFDDDGTTYFLSTGGPADSDKVYPYVQGRFSARPIQAIRVNVKGGPYRMYVSLQKSDGTWYGRQRIPYVAGDPTAGEVDTGADIKYVAAYDIDSNDVSAFRLPRQFLDVVKVRYTFGHLWDSGVGTTDRYRVAVKSVVLAEEASDIAATTTHKIGNYNDYTDIVKWVCAWAGLYWPRTPAEGAFRMATDGTKMLFAPSPPDDAALPKGRVWGDFEPTLVAGVSKLGVEVTDKKPLMDIIAQVRETVGFDFWIDEQGAVVWRLPNVFSKGNYVSPLSGGPGALNDRVTTIPVIDERTTLIEMTPTISSRNVRERVFVANIAGKFGAVVKGFNPHRSGLRRVGGWTDQRFETEDECTRMADLIALRQSFLYRKNSITIAGNPQIQIDDQVRVYERKSGEGFIHRVQAISSEYDFDSGRWTYTLETNWLGEDAFTKWAFDPELLEPATKNYLQQMGKI